MPTTATEWQELADGLDLRTKAFIGGEYVDAASGETFESIDPATGAKRADVAAAGSEDVDRAVRAARASFESGVWAEAAPLERKGTLLRLADLLEANADELAALMTIDMGKPIGDAVGEVGISARNLRWFAELVDKVYGEVAPLPRMAHAYITREPIGVVGAIVPWNYPLLMPMWKLSPALATGNSVVLKPAEQSPLVALKLAELAAEAGLPDGVLNVVPGLGETAGKALAQHMDVDKVAFTGSTEVGRLMMRYAAESNLKKVSLELGGKSPAVILADAPDMSFVAGMAAEGIYANAGQVCNAGSRLFVHREVRDEFVEELAKASEKWQPGNPFDPSTAMGPLVSESQLERVTGYMDVARDEGADVSLGGNRANGEGGGYFFEPTILSGVDNNMRVAQEEIFGPVVVTIDFDSDEEGIRLANESPYGLAAGVFTRDVSKAHKLARKLRAGSVYVNCWDYGGDTLPVGGYKQSGTGRDKSLHALDNYTELKSTYVYLDV